MGENTTKKKMKLRELPKGMRFAPTPTELIRHYLNVWVTDPAAYDSPGEEGAPATVCVADIYSEPPATLTARFASAGHDDGNWYFLCVNRWHNPALGAGKFKRTVESGGGGTWHGGGKRIPVGDVGHRVGFEYFKDNRKSEWIMEELGTNLPAATTSQGVKVLCRVHKTKAPVDDGEEGARQGTRRARASKRQRTRASGRQDRQAEQQGYYSAAGCTAPPAQNAGFSSYAATTSTEASAMEAWRQWQWQWQQAMMRHGAAPPDYGFSYGASTSAAAALATTWQQQQQPMDQALGYQYNQYFTGVHGGVGFQNEPVPLETVAPDNVEQQQWTQMGCPNGGVHIKDDTAPLETVAPDNVQQQQWPQMGCANGGVHIKDESEPLGVATAYNVDPQQWSQIGCVDGGVDMQDEAAPLETATADAQQQPMEQQQWSQMGCANDGVGTQGQPAPLETATADTQQQQTEQQQWSQMGCANGGVDIQGQPPPLETYTGHMEPLLFPDVGYGFGYNTGPEEDDGWGYEYNLWSYPDPGEIAQENGDPNRGTGASS